jgi:hypothetical protein
MNAYFGGGALLGVQDAHLKSASGRLKGGIENGVKTLRSA